MSLSSLVTLLGVYLFLPLLLRALGGVRQEDEPWRTLPDLALALVIGLVSTALCYTWLAPHYLNGWPAVTRDFAKICGDVHLHRLWITAGEPWLDRTLSLLPSALLATHLGIVNSLLVITVFSNVVILGSVHLMARVLLGRWAGIVAALLAGAIFSVPETSHLLHYYPLHAALYTVATTCTLLAVRYDFRLATLGVGLTMAVALLMDSRGVYHLAAPALVALVAIFRGPWRSRLSRLALLVLPLLASWIIAWGISPREHTLEHRQWLLLEDVVQGESHQMLDPDRLEGLGWDPEFGRDGYTWGRPPWLLPRALLRIWRMSSSAKPSLSYALQRNDPAIKTHVLPWLPWLALSGLLAAWALRRRPMLLLSMVVLLSPPAVMTWFTATTQFSIRLLCLTIWFAPVLLGCGFAGAMTIVGGYRGPDLGFRSRHLQTAVLVGAILTLVTGLVPSWLQPEAAWRRSTFWEPPDIAALYRARPAQEQADTGEWSHGRGETDLMCVAGIRADMERGLRWGGWLEWPESETGLEGQGERAPYVGPP